MMPDLSNEVLEFPFSHFAEYGKKVFEVQALPEGDSF
jgi:hypothetical protein